MRQVWVRVHRYAGLFMAAFLVIIGLTGSIIVFNPELNAWLDPPPKLAGPAGMPLLDPHVLHDIAQALVPEAAIHRLPLHLKPGEPYVAALTPRLDPATGKPFVLKAASLLLDPCTGQPLLQEAPSTEMWPITRKNIMPLINRLHYQLAVPGEIGTWLFGVVALVWTLDCFVSAYLTFPVAVRAHEGAASRRPTHRKSWWLRWLPAWRVRWKASAYRLNFDLHRAGGLWVWGMLLVFAWSGVGFNLYEQIYLPAMKAAFAMPDGFGRDWHTVDTVTAEPPLPWREAHAKARALMAQQARLNGFEIVAEQSLTYLPDKAAYLYIVRSDRDLVDAGGLSTLVFEARAGGLQELSLPRGQNLGGTLNNWVFALHTATVWGLPFRIFVSFMGLLVAMLSATGVYLWLKKHRARRTAGHRTQRFPRAGDSAVRR